MPTHAVFSCILPAQLSQGAMSERLTFPRYAHIQKNKPYNDHRSVLGQTSKINKSWRQLRELHLHLCLHISGDKNEVRQSYLPALVPRMTQPLIQRGSVSVTYQTKHIHFTQTMCIPNSIKD